MNNVQEKDWAEDSWCGHTGMDSSSDYCSRDRVVDIEKTREKREKEAASLPPFKLEYALTGPGAARLVIRYGENEKSIPALSFSDPLLSLAEAAIQLNKSILATSVVLMDEVEEHSLQLTPDEEDFLEFELRWYEKWASWGQLSPEEYTVSFKGKTTVEAFCSQVLHILTDIYENLGPQQYKKQWIEGDFPEHEFTILKKLIAI